jgi:P27 family predicted phage terminase small subunit
MSRGRTSKPTALKSLQGNAGHRSKADRAGKEPAPPAGAPEPPAHLDARAKRKWYEILGVMMQVAGWVTLMDGDVLAAYCSAYARWQEAETQIPLLRKRIARCKSDLPQNGDGLRASSGDKPQARQKARTGKERLSYGQLVNELNSMIGQQRHALKDMKTFGQEFGWSSASRTRIRMNDGQLALAGFGGAATTPAAAESEFEKQSRLASS